jgi:hypothetical protein
MDHLSYMISNAGRSFFGFYKHHCIKEHPQNQVLKETTKANFVQWTGFNQFLWIHWTESMLKVKKLRKKSRKTATKKGKKLIIFISWLKTTSVAHICHFKQMKDEINCIILSYFCRINRKKAQVMIRYQ